MKLTYKHATKPESGIQLYLNPGHGIDHTPPSEVVYGLSNTSSYPVFLHGVLQGGRYLYLYRKRWVALTSRQVQSFLLVGNASHTKESDQQFKFVKFISDSGDCWCDILIK
jgi:hypothetical protein